jgi:TRAP-type C4-dicarboxylate transport system permease small subunit
MSKQIFDALPKNQRDIIMAVGEEMETFGTQGAKADDQAVAGVYQKAGAKVYDLDAATLKKWQDIARGARPGRITPRRTKRAPKIMKAAEKLPLSREIEAGLEPRPERAVPPGPLAPPSARSRSMNRWIVRAGSVALIGASAVLTYSVVSRYFFKAATDWQDEAAVFCIVGAVFVRVRLRAVVPRPHRHRSSRLFLSPRANRVRAIVVDIASFIFCTFFAWKSWTLWHEALVDKQTTTSAWGPPLWIPVRLHGLGMTLLALQLALQIAGASCARSDTPR